MPASLTTRRDLPAGGSTWMARRAPSVASAPLTWNISCDVAVTGSGISGSLIAGNLSKTGLSVVILDRREPGQGSPPASTAMLQYELSTPMAQTAKRIGRDYGELSLRLPRVRDRPGVELRRAPKRLPSCHEARRAHIEGKRRILHIFRGRAPVNGLIARL
jgi:glycine/D-amino acid oxidase-like deaminating enzyme